MSSTNRGSKRDPSDFYETPAWCVEALLPHLRPFASVLDPAAGRGAILDAVRAARPDVETAGIELDAERAEVCGTKHRTICGDALRCPWPVGDLVLANPPFSYAIEFANVGAVGALCGMHGESAMLCRLGLLAGQRRRDFWRSHPADVWVLSKRPSFTGKGTDSADYCWAVWGPGARGRWGVL